MSSDCFKNFFFFFSVLRLLWLKVKAFYFILFFLFKERYVFSYWRGEKILNFGNNRSVRFNRFKSLDVGGMVGVVGGGSKQQ